MRPLTRAELGQRKTKIYIATSLAIGVTLIIYAMFSPATNIDNGNYPDIDIPIGNNIVLIEPPVVEEEKPVININHAHAKMLARLAWGEARGCTTTEQAAVMWCALNRVDSDNKDFKDTIEAVITQPSQFYYSETFPLKDELLDLAYDVLTRWHTEKETGELDSGRVLPKEYCFFHGDGKHNYFRDKYEFKDANIWDWSWDSPYEE